MAVVRDDETYPMEPTVLTNTCGALTSSGTPCRRYTIRGGTRCTLHGGGSPEARRKAEEMLAIARLPAARVLARIIDDYEADKCAACGRPTGDVTPVIRAAFGVLDRTGLHPSMGVQLGRAEDHALADLSEDELIGQLEEMLESARAAREAKRAQQPDPIDAEVIVVEADSEADAANSAQLQDGYSDLGND